MDRRIPRQASVLVALTVCLVAGIAPAQPPAPAAPRAAAGVREADATAAADAQSAQRFQELVTALVREHLPTEFEKKDHWGQTTEVWDGVHVSHDGLRIKTRSRKKEVNHGTWKLYRVRLVDPDKQFHIRVANVREAPGGRVAVDVFAEAALAVFGRLAQWERGVQLISLRAEADARVRLRVHCNLALQLDLGKLPPDIVLDAKVTDATLELAEFRLRRISAFHGPVVRELSHGVRDVIERQLQDKRPQLVEKINRQIAKHPRALRFSLHDLLASKWGALAAPYLPAGSSSVGRQGQVP